MVGVYKMTVIVSEIAREQMTVEEYPQLPNKKAEETRSLGLAKVHEWVPCQTLEV
jgi:hypothetical protein